MMKITHVLFTALLALTSISYADAEGSLSKSGDVIPVTVENFTRAESDFFMSNVALKQGAFGKLYHYRKLPTVGVNQRTVVRTNRDTLYSTGVFDLDAGPVTITLPEANGRFMSLQAVNEDHYSPPGIYAAGAHTFTREAIGTRYFLINIRTLFNPTDPQDLGKLNALQDAIKVEQKSSGEFEVPKWDPVSQKKIRDALLVLASAQTDTRRSFGTKNEVEPISHLITTASLWGGNPAKDALYLNFEPSANDGERAYTLTVKDVPVDSFWSISVYDADGYFTKNDLDLYTINNLTAKKAADGTVVIHFGGDAKAPNYIPITKGWNYTVRLYRPRAEILDGTWKFPEPQLVK